MKRQGIITFIGDQALFHSPKTNEDRRVVKSNFGMLNEDYRQSIINSNIEDATPKEEDFLPFMFRHITATIVGGGSWKATDFSKKGVLKKAVSLFQNKPVYVNHEFDVSNIVGGVGAAKYTEEFKAEDGTVIPAGIDAPIYIDGKLHPDLTRKMQAYPVPHIQSVSVSVLFEWEPSHEFQNREGDPDEWLFESRIGEMVEGEMVRRIVTDVVDAYETSLVWLGADPFAKILDENGTPVNVEKSAVISAEKFEKDPLVNLYKKKGRYFVYENCFGSQKTLDLHKRHVLNYEKEEKTNFNQPKNDNMDLKNLIAQKLGVKPEEVTEDLLSGYTIVKSDDYSTLKANADKLPKKETELKTATEKVEKFEKVMPFDKIDTVSETLKDFGEQANVETLLPHAKFGKETLDSKRQLCEKHYKLAVGEGNEDDSVLKLIRNADREAIQGLLKQYGKSNAESFAGSCNECGSENVSFRSTEPEGDGGEGGKPANNGFDMPNAFRK